jgi:hypothetical protein
MAPEWRAASSKSSTPNLRRIPGTPRPAAALSPCRRPPPEPRWKTLRVIPARPRPGPTGPRPGTTGSRIHAPRPQSGAARPGLAPQTTIPCHRPAIPSRQTTVPWHRAAAHSRQAAVHSRQTWVIFHQTAVPGHSSAALSARHQDFMPKWLFLPSQTAAHAPKLKNYARHRPMPAQPREGCKALLRGLQFPQVAPAQ